LILELIEDAESREDGLPPWTPRKSRLLNNFWEFVSEHDFVDNSRISALLQLRVGQVRLTEILVLL
jgi:hypothetical protein